MVWPGIFGSDSRVGLIAQLLQEDSLTAEESRQLREIAGELSADVPAQTNKIDERITLPTFCPTYSASARCCFLCRVIETQ